MNKQDLECLHCTIPDKFCLGIPKACKAKYDKHLKKKEEKQAKEIEKKIRKLLKN